MEKLLTTLLIVHVITGFTAFLTGPFAILSNKSGKLHKPTGWIFSGAMSITIASSLVISIYKQLIFLLLVAIFSAYFIFSGLRIFKIRKAQGLRWFDWLVHISFAMSCIGFITYGIIIQANLGFNSLVMLCFLFGVGGITTIYGNIKPLRVTHSSYNEKIRYHLGNMIGAYIAAVTAFSSQQFNFMPVLLQWTWPTIFFLPVSFYFSRKIRLSEKPVGFVK